MGSAGSRPQAAAVSTEPVVFSPGIPASRPGQAKKASENGKKAGSGVQVIARGGVHAITERRTRPWAPLSRTDTGTWADVCAALRKELIVREASESECQSGFLPYLDT